MKTIDELLAWLGSQPATVRTEDVTARVRQVEMAQAEAHRAGLVAARRYTRWHIGDGSWGINVIDAYRNPERAIRELDEEFLGA